MSGDLEINDTLITNNTIEGLLSNDLIEANYFANTIISGTKFLNNINGHCLFAAILDSNLLITDSIFIGNTEIKTLIDVNIAGNIDD